MGFHDDSTGEINEAALVARGLGLRPSGRPTDQGRSDEAIEEDLEELAAILDGLATEIVDSASDAELETAKGEAAFVLDLLRSLPCVEEDRVPEELIAVREFGRIVGEASASDYAQFLIFWLRLRGASDFRAEFDTVLGALCDDEIGS